MKQLMGLMIISALLAFAPVNSTSIYSYTLTAADGSSIALSQYQGKKILIVNTALQSANSNQLAGLQQLYNAYKDSGLVVIACPSNSFGNEPGSGTSLVQAYQTQQGIGFPVTAKLSVKGADANPVYQWLQDKDLNGVMNTEVKGDFHKYLIDESGMLVGTFSAKVQPGDAVMRRAIER
jgi:glutathione peroxidase